MTTELVLLGTAGAPMPVAGRAGTSSALVVDRRVFVIDCGRGSPSAFADTGLDFTRLEAVFLTHLHGDRPVISPACWCTRGAVAWTTTGHWTRSGSIGRRDPEAARR